jgi:hypothetical protein
MVKKIISFFLVFCFVFEQTGFAQVAPQMHIPGYLSGFTLADRFRPVHLRALSFGSDKDSLGLVLDKGDSPNLRPGQVEQTAGQLMEYFHIGLRLPNSLFWVNLRPDSPDNVIDPYLEQTEIGKIFLEADLQLKKDVARFTSPDTAEGRQYWMKLYAKAESVFGQQDMEVPALVRPWIVPGEIIIRESPESAYVYKATLKVMLEQDYIKDSPFYNFSDPKLKEINAYSSQLIREEIIPKLTREVNSSKRYAALRQVYYSLILAQWFKQRKASGLRPPASDLFIKEIDSKDLSGFTSKSRWTKDKYFKAYQKSFSQGEYNKEEQIQGPSGLTIRTYFSGGIMIPSALEGDSSALTKVTVPTVIQTINGRTGQTWQLRPGKRDSEFEVVPTVTNPKDGGTPKDDLKKQLELRILQKRYPEAVLKDRIKYTRRIGKLGIREGMNFLVKQSRGLLDSDQDMVAIAKAIAEISQLNGNYEYISRLIRPMREMSVPEYEAGAKNGLGHPLAENEVFITSLLEAIAALRAANEKNEMLEDIQMYLSIERAEFALQEQNDIQRKTAAMKDLAALAQSVLNQDSGWTRYIFGLLKTELYKSVPTKQGIVALDSLAAMLNVILAYRKAFKNSNLLEEYTAILYDALAFDALDIRKKAAEQIVSLADGKENERIISPESIFAELRRRNAPADELELVFKALGGNPKDGGSAQRPVLPQGFGDNLKNTEERYSLNVKRLLGESRDRFFIPTPNKGAVEGSPFLDLLNEMKVAEDQAGPFQSSLTGQQIKYADFAKDLKLSGLENPLLKWNNIRLPLSVRIRWMLEDLYTRLVGYLGMYLRGEQLETTDTEEISPNDLPLSSSTVSVDDAGGANINQPKDGGTIDDYKSELTNQRLMNRFIAKEDLESMHDMRGLVEFLLKTTDKINKEIEAKRAEAIKQSALVIEHTKNKENIEGSPDAVETIASLQNWIATAAERAQAAEEDAKAASRALKWLNDFQNRIQKENLVKSGADGGTPNQAQDGGTLKGGIDFRALPIITNPGMMPGAMNPIDIKALEILAQNSNIKDLDQEWLKIEQEMQTKTMPYAKMKEFLAVCCQKKDAIHKEKALASVMDILKLEEERAVSTAPELKEILALAEINV